MDRTDSSGAKDPEGSESPESRESCEGPLARPEDESGNGVVVAFGRQLKLLRVQAGLERPEFGRLTGYAPQSIASFEQGRRIPQPSFIDRADEVLSAGGVLKALKEQVLRAQYPAFFRDMARLEAKAEGISVYALYAVCRASCRPRRTRVPGSTSNARCSTTM